MAYGPIQLANASGQVMVQQRWPEGASLTCKQGVPLRLSSGNLIPCDMATSSGADWGSADIVVGVSSEPGHNLTTAGTPEPAYSEGTPPNQPLGRIIPRGAWLRDGKIGFYPANGVNVFLISLATGVSYTEALKVAVGTYYALKYDSTSGFWYCDSGDTSGNNICLEILGGVSDDATKVLVRFKASQRQFD